MKQSPYLVLDFDSTLVDVESLDLLAEKALLGQPEREKILNEVRQITASGMEGKIPFSESLSQRLQLFRAHRDSVDRTAKEVPGHVSSSILREKDWLRANADRIYIVSSGFEEIIFPVADLFGIEREHVRANRFVYDDEGYVSSVDKSTFFAHDHGKAMQVRSLALPNTVCAIGDGYTDYEMKSLGGAEWFLAYTENISRPSVVDLADRVFSDFGDVIDFVSGLEQ